MEDYTRNRHYRDLMQSMLGRSMAPVQGANAGTALANIMAAYFAGQGMNRANMGMKQAEQAERDARKRTLSDAMSAYYGDTAYTPSEGEYFDSPTELPGGLKNRGSERNTEALAAAMLGSDDPGFQEIGLTQLLSTPKDTRTTAQKNAEAMGLIPGSPDYNAYIERATKSGVNINMGDFKMPAGHMRNPSYDPNKPASEDNRPVMPIPGSKTAQDAARLPDAAMSSANFATRMVEAEKTFDSIESVGYDPTNLTDALANNGGKLGNFFKSPQGRRYYQAAADWVRAKLRKESGAVIGPQEMLDEIATYFPMPGDDPATIQQKKRARMIATNGMIDQSQGGFKGDRFAIPDIQPVSPVLPEGVTEEDIQYTMKKNNMTRQQVMELF